MRRLVLGIALLFAAGCETGRVDAEPSVVPRFHLETPLVENAMTAELPVSGVRLTFATKPVLTEQDIANVEVAEVELGRCLLFQLTPAAARDLFRITASHQGRRLVLTLNGRALGARRIEAPIEEGNLAMFIELPDTELASVVRGVRQALIDLETADKR